MPGGFAANLCAEGKLLEYGVFKCFRSAQTYDSLGLDLNSLTRCGVTAHTRLTMRFHRAAETRNYEFARSLCFFYGQLEEFVKERRDLLLGHRLLRSAYLLGHVCNDLRFAQRICHRVLFPPRCNFFLHPEFGMPCGL